MGAETSALLNELAQEIAAREGAARTTESELTRNGWDPKDHSPNINLDDLKLKAVRNDSESGVDGVRGVMTYRRGVHLIDFEWTPATDKYVAVGVATTSAPISSTDSSAQLVGMTDQSVGWNLVTQKIYFNGCENGKFPEDAPSSYKVPSKVTMILDMDDGRLLFKTGASSIDVAMKGLKHIGEKLYVMVAMNKPWDTVKIKYLGEHGKLQRELEFQTAGGLLFHETRGQNAFLGNDNKTAARRDVEENKGGATVLTHRPLKEDEIFAVRLDRVVKTKQYGCGWSVGLTSVGPLEMRFERDMSKSHQGKTWLCSANKIYFQRQSSEKTQYDIDELEVGETIGLKKSGRTMTMYVNDTEVAEIDMDDDIPVYGFVDIFGHTKQVSIVGEDEMKQKSLTSSGSTVRMPRTMDEYQKNVLKVVQMFDDREQGNIPSIWGLCDLWLFHPLDCMKLETYKIRSAEFFASIPDSAKKLTGYLRFVWSCISGDDDGTEAIKCYLCLLRIIVYYTGKSIKLSKQLGDSGLVSTLLIAVKNIDHSNLKTSKLRIRFVVRWLRILQNCARVADNQRFYGSENYPSIAEDYLKDNEDEYTIVVPIIMTQCFLAEDDKPPVLSSNSVKHILMVFHKAVSLDRSDGSHHFEGWCAHEMAMCIGMLGQNDDNVRKLTAEKELFTNLLKMLSFEEGKDQECALNAFWSVSRPDNCTDLFKLPGFLDKLRALIQKGSESVVMAARRLTLKLDSYRERAKGHTLKTRDCDYLAKCAQFLESLGLHKSLLDARFNKCYCVECHSRRSDKAYYTRGNPPKTHAIPVGWVRYGLSVPARAISLDVHKKWHTAYHGTKTEHVGRILDVGTLVPAGREVMGGFNIKEGSKHFDENYKPEGFDTKQVFLSPSIRYAGVNTYARPSSFSIADKSGKQTSYVARVAFQVFIKPDSYSVGKETLGASQLIDPGFSNQELEWSTTQEGSHILNAILVKLEKN